MFYRFYLEKTPGSGTWNVISENKFGGTAVLCVCATKALASDTIRVLRLGADIDRRNKAESYGL